ETFRQDVLCLCTSSPILLHPAGSCTVTVCFLRQSRLAALFPECCLYSPAGKEAFPVSFSRSDFSPVEKDRIRDILSELSSMASDRKCAPQKSAALLTLLGLLPDSFFRPALPPPKKQLSPRQEELYHALYSYMVSHCDEGLKQPQAARLFSITPQYAGQILQEGCGMTFRECLLSFKDHRQHLIRKLYEAEKAAPSLVSSCPHPVSVEAYRELPALEADAVRIFGEKKDIYNRLINLGYASSLRSIELEKTLKEIQAEVGFSYGRICRITDLIYESSMGTELYYDYRQVFLLLDTLQEYRLIPFLELGNKALMIHENVSVSFKADPAMSSVSYYERLLNVLPGFLAACINHYGQEYFDQWYFEISYMYTDLHEMESFSFRQYLKVFRLVYQKIRSFSPFCRIGGPGFNDWSEPGRISRTIDLMKQQNAVPDFFSAYLYPVHFDPESQKTVSLSPSLAVERIHGAIGILKASLPGTGLWITECNSSLSSRNLLNDSHYQAVWLTWMIMAAGRTCVEALGYYLLSDSPLHYMNSLDFLFGGWGLFSDQNIPKPSFYAYQLMSRLGPYILRQEDYCLVTAGSPGNVQILAFSFSPPKQEYIQSNADRNDLLHPQELFERQGQDHFRISLSSMPQGIYILKEYRIDDAHASLFGAWSRLDFLMPRDELTLKELAMASCPIPALKTVRIEEQRPFLLELSLPAVSICLVTLELYASHLK
ncbi:MAG: hypothetical protein IIY55_09375, partial [Blautia sp.]|nr:hypothetical protein [Blautia sp.]